MKANTLFFVVTLCTLFVAVNTNAQNGVIKTFAGTGVAGFSGDGGPAISAQLDTPKAVAVDKFGNVYISTAARIRKVNPSGIITTIAGNGVSAFYGEGIPATAAQLVLPSAIAIDNSGNIFFADQNRVRQINTAGMINTIAGTGVAGYSGDGGLATNAQLNSAQGVAIDASGNIYFSDAGNKRIRKVTPTGIISTFAGNGTASYSGDGGPATAAGLLTQGITFDYAGNLIAADASNNRIRKINTTGIITTIAGNGLAGFSGDGRAATLASINNPCDVAIDNAGNVIIADRSNYRIRVLNLVSGKINTIAGGNSTFHGDNGYSARSGFTTVGIAIDSFNSIYIADYSHKRVRKIKQMAFVNLYLDANSNCLFDNSEYRINNPITIEVDSNGISVDTLSTTSAFYYDMQGVLGDIYTFKTITMPASIINSCPVSGSISDTIHSTLGSYFIKNMGFNCSSSSGFDLGVKSHIPITGRFEQRGYAYIDNNSCVPSNVTVTLNFSPKYIFSGTALPTPTSFSGNTITWDLTGLSLNTAQLPNTLYYELDHPVSGPLTIGDTVHTNILVTPTTGDFNPGNNAIIVVDTVRASCDPNDIVVQPNGYIPSGTLLEYSIRFENVGNDTAFNIYIMDSLSEHLDPKSFRIISSSAVMNTTMLHNSVNNILKFDFPNINLLDSSHHGECDGMVRYIIRTRNGLPNGTQILNRAGIYFDDNGVVMTNTAENIIGIPDKIVDVKTYHVYLYPNPTTNQLTIKTEQNAYTSVTISNNIGQAMLQQVLSNDQTVIDVKSLPSGLYYVTMKGVTGTKTIKFVKI